MTDACTITRPGERVYDSTTGTYSTHSTPVYDGKCRVRPAGTQGRTAQAGERDVSTWPYLVSLPLSVADVRQDDTLTVTESADPALVGLPLRVRDVAKGTHITARRLGCEEQEAT